MAQVSKSFHELTEQEAKKIVKGIVRSSHSEEEIRKRLTEAGFSGAGALIAEDRCCDGFQVMVRSPHGKTISISAH